MQTIAMFLVVLGALGGGSADEHDPVTTVRIKATVAVRGLDVTIGELCELPDDAAAIAIGAIKFGPAPVNGHSRTVSRTEIVQALAAAGVDLAAVKVEGADEAVVQAILVEVPGQDLLDAATAALQAQLGVEGGDVEFEAPARLRTVQAPPGRRSQDLRARVRGSKTGPNSAIVDVEVLVDGASHKKVPITFRLQRFHQVLKTIGAVRAGTPLGPDNLTVAREPIDQVGLFLDRIEALDGMIAARNLQANQRLTLGDAAPPAVVRKGDIVTVVLTRGRVKVTAKAMANQDAPLGGRISLTNLQSRSQLSGFVHGAGLVVVPQ